MKPQNSDSREDRFRAMRAFKLSYLSPIYAKTWLVIGLSFVVAALPARWRIRLGIALGAVLFRLMRRRRKIAQINLRACFPQAPQAEIERLLRSHFREVGIGLIATSWGFWHSSRQLATAVDLDDSEAWDLLRNASEGESGTLLMVLHSVDIYLSGILFGLKHRFYSTPRPHNNPLLNRWIQRSLYGHGVLPLDHRAVFQQASFLSSGCNISFPPDHDYGLVARVFAPFFGIPAATTTTPHVLARRCGSRVVMIYLERHGHRYLLKARELKGFAKMTKEEAAKTINEAVENIIAVQPERWLWNHRRFKTRPESDTADFYSGL